MNNAEQSHISPDTLEEAARGHLTAGRLAAVDAHCTVCAACKAAYEEELRIARGTRSWARTALKQRLASRVASQNGPQVPWTRILAAAAAILVIAGTGIIYQWLRVPPESTRGSNTLTSTTDGIPAPGGGKDIQESAEALARRPLPPAADMKEAVQEEAHRTRAKREREALALAPPPAPAEAPPMAAKLTGEAADAMQKSTGGEYIMWGNVLPLESEGKEKAGLSRDISSEDARVEARGAQMQGVRKTNAPATSRYTVDQEIILPMYRRDAGSRPGQIPSRITRMGDTINIVLLLETLFPDDVISSATVLEYPPDSLQVLLRGRWYGFRTPPGFLP
jgi:hypothetical protein